MNCASSSLRSLVLLKHVLLYWDVIYGVLRRKWDGNWTGGTDDFVLLLSFRLLFLPGHDGRELRILVLAGSFVYPFAF